jgi:C-terminal processing protease CtpA/Prc
MWYPLGPKAVILCRPGQAFQNSVPQSRRSDIGPENQAVLVSPTTSAAEIVSGAVQDLDAGIVVVLDLRQGIGAEC